MIGLYVAIVLEKLEALLMSGLWLGPPKSPHIEELELLKPVAAIPHQRKQEADEGQNARYHAEKVYSWERSGQRNPSVPSLGQYQWFGY